MAPFVYIPPPIVVRTSSGGDASPWMLVPAILAILALGWALLELMCWLERIGDRYDAIKARKRGEPVYRTEFSESPTRKYWFMTRRWFRRKFKL